MRENYLKRLVEYFRPLFIELCPELAAKKFTLRYVQGWNKETEYSTYLAENVERDQALGYTRSGAHAADWSLRVDGADPYEMLSRGQQKLFFLALCMAQIKLLAESKQLSNSILLIDDLSSELDWQHQQTVISTLRTLPVQSFISTTNDQLMTLLREENERLFHVKHGRVSAELG